MKACRETVYAKVNEDWKYIPCPNPVEDEIRAWGQIINPVRCKECRAKKKYFSRAEQEKRTIQQIHAHYANHEECERKTKVCTAFDW